MNRLLLKMREEFEEEYSVTDGRTERVNNNISEGYVESMDINTARPLTKMCDNA